MPGVSWAGEPSGGPGESPCSVAGAGLLNRLGRIPSPTAAARILYESSMSSDSSQYQAMAWERDKYHSRNTYLSTKVMQDSSHAAGDKPSPVAPFLTRSSRKPSFTPHRERILLRSWCSVVLRQGGRKSNPSSTSTLQIQAARTKPKTGPRVQAAPTKSNQAKCLGQLLYSILEPLLHSCVTSACCFEFLGAASVASVPARGMLRRSGYGTCHSDFSKQHAQN